MDNLRDQFAIVGLGKTRMGRWPHTTGRALQAEAARLAIEDAGLTREDIDGTIHVKGETGSRSSYNWTDAYPRVLGLPAKFYFSIGRGGAGATYAIAAAMGFLQMGIAKYIMIAYGTEAWSGSHIANRSTGSAERPGAWGPPFGAVRAVSDHAFFAARHMHEYGTTSRQLGAIAVAERAWAGMNPAACMYGKPITIEDHQKSPLVVWPYHLLDMSLQTDGGSAIILTTAERARALKKPPVYVMGIGCGEAMRKLWWDKGNYTQLDVAPAKADAFRQAGVELRDIDVALLYDCFTGEVLFQLEDYGWCKKGEGGSFVEAGNTAPGGTIPVNTGGGLLSSHHHIDFTGVSEAIIQLRREAGARQVKDAEICLVSGHGGEILRPGMCSLHSTLILRR